jgi:hypothetical protein
MRIRRLLLPSSLVVLGALALGSCTSSTEPAKPTSIELSVAAVTLDAIGATRQVTASVLDQRGKALSGASVDWTSSIPSAATVSGTGLITAVGDGATSVAASVGGVVAALTVQVTQVPVAPVVIQGDGQSGTVQSQLAMPLQVRVEDRLGNAMVGKQVTFAVTAGGGSLGTPTVMSGAGGLASTTWTIGASTVGLQRVSATVQGNPNATVISATPLAGPAVLLGIAPGNIANGQFAGKGTAVQIKPAVELTDALGNGVANASVTFSVLSGGGSVTGGTALTNVNGIATVGSWTLGPSVGTNTLQASFGGLTPVVFTATATEDPCTPAGAIPIAVGDTRAGTITGNDCVLAPPGSESFDLYRLDLASSASLVLEVTADFDPWLFVLDYNTLAVVAENDDIDPGVIQNSRIVTTLPAGSYLLRVRTFDAGQVGSYSLSVRAATAGVPASVVLNGGDAQIAAPGAAVPIVPSVTVRDESGSPVVGVSVAFSIIPGLGSIGNASAVTNASGIATVGSWTLGAGPNVLAATVAGGSFTGNPVVFSATGKASAAGFDIALRFVAMPSETQLQTFKNAVARWESIINVDVPAQLVNFSAGSCNSPRALNETVDDLVIVVRLEPIDGVGQILGSAGPCALRSGSALPVVGTMRFDTADLVNLEANGSFGNVILHEMGHVLGIGTIWSNKGLLANPSLPNASGADTHFTGANGIAGFDAIGGSAWSGGSKVPVENTQGGAGTRDSHWRESVLANELMTGFLNGGSNPLSLLTIRSLEDLGYSVATAQADAFFLSLNLLAEGSSSPAGVQMKDDVWRGEMFYVEPSGRPVGAGAPAPVKKHR